MDSLIASKAERIKILFLDVDGILSDGKIVYGNSGEELKSFSILDGLGIKLAQRSGVEVAIITGRQSAIVERRANELGIKHLFQGREDKLVAMEHILTEIGLNHESAAYMGDDLPDLSAIRAAGLGITVPNGHHFVKAHADYCTLAVGGNGAVREVCDLILEAKGCLASTLDSYL